MDKVKVVFIPGNGGGSSQDNWFPSVGKQLQGAGIAVVAEEFPDNELAPQSSWLPFLLDELHVDEHTILVGHSTGAIAAMRLAEQRKIYASVLVGAYYTDLDMETERRAGYFDQPWDWQKIRSNQQWITLFASQDDPWISIDEPRFLHQQLNCEYHEYIDQGHFGGDYHKADFPELAQVIIHNLQRGSDKH